MFQNLPFSLSPPRERVAGEGFEKITGGFETRSKLPGSGTARKSTQENGRRALYRWHYPKSHFQVVVTGAAKACRSVFFVRPERFAPWPDSGTGFGSGAK